MDYSGEDVFGNQIGGADDENLDRIIVEEKKIVNGFLEEITFIFLPHYRYENRNVFGDIVGKIELHASNTKAMKGIKMQGNVQRMIKKTII